MFSQRIILLSIVCIFALSFAFMGYGCGDDDDDDDDSSADDDDGNDDDNDDDADDDDDDDEDTVSVPADSAAGLDTGIDVEEGDELSFTATGTVTLTAGGQTSTPDGVTGQTCNSQDCPMPDENWGGLIGLIMTSDDTTKSDIVNCLFWIGSNWTQSAACGGRLVLVVNDFSYTDNSGSFSVKVIHGSGAGKTWTDSTTGLEWQKQAKTGDPISYEDAEEYCSTLTLDDKTGWRLPNIDELRSLVRGCPETETDGDCALTDDCNDADCFNIDSEACTGCEVLAGPTDDCYWPNEIGGICEFYWSTTRWGDNIDYAWGVNYDRAAVGNHYIPNEPTNSRVRCVR